MKINELENGIIEIEYSAEDNKGFSVERFHKSKIQRVTLCKRGEQCHLQMERHELLVTNDLLDSQGFKNGTEVFNFLTSLIGE